MRQDDIISNVHFPPNNFSAVYRKDWRRSWLVVKNIFDAFITDRDEITLATQISLTRLNAFRLVLDRWKGEGMNHFSNLFVTFFVEKF